MNQSRRKFLNLAVCAAPLVFVPKLIVGVNWGIQKHWGQVVEIWIGDGALYEWIPNS